MGRKLNLNQNRPQKKKPPTDLWLQLQEEQEASNKGGGGRKHNKILRMGRGRRENWQAHLKNQESSGG